MPSRSHSAAAIAAFCAIASGCANYQPPAAFAGFSSPLVARNSCVDSVSREFKVPKENVKPINDASTMIDGIYVVSLSIGAGQPLINCTVNENGNVSDVIRAR
ncbi:hypothetical protein QTI24_23860 [Variovorax sp. J22P240]|uniref:hypothetical protein n=1 Tax=unclassified Variovorax TaxID=663243 RepID=UPI0025776323|nr:MULTISPECIES: hypothetical protein [unclassified Variovorax]MDM0001663.1 hypothetical protein [Variovorax sp. J22P240]MDM0053430.1 hypothetical protein [Variovorax sp. J22R115]